MTRNFNAQQRAALYLAADGKCQMCGDELGDDWEADHVHPYSKGGKTDIINGQALCQACNRKKGNRALSKIELRPFQQEFVRVAVTKARTNQKVVVAHAAAGSGKTLGSQAAANELLRLGFIDQVVVLVPRLNLAAQYELDWEEMRDKLDAEVVMRHLFHRSNSARTLMAKGADGYVTTYQSLCANPQPHLRIVAQRRTLVILDEAQQLGYDPQGSDIRIAAKWVQEIGQHASMVFVMSGTPYRADGLPLLFAEYGEKDSTGYAPLIPDLEATYRDGIREQYLRRFEYRMADGGYTWNDFVSGDEIEYNISDPEASIYHALRLEGFWKPLTDKFVDVLNDQQTSVDSRFCGLIACTSQEQAREVEQYLNQHYPSKRVLIAISDDGSAAHQALRSFKNGGYDILVTVSMAYVGYDHKWINTVLLLTHIRSRAYLMQLVARGLRVLSSIEYNHQYCYVIAPDDPKMQEFVNFMRGEVEAGYQDIAKQERESNDSEGKRVELGYASDAFISQLRALGVDPDSDLTPEELVIADRLKKANGLPYSVSEMMSIYRMMNAAFGGSTKQHSTPQRPRKTHAEQLTDAKANLKEYCGTLGYILSGGNKPEGVHYQKIYGALNRLYGQSSKHSDDLEDLQSRIKTVLRWIDIGRIDGGR